MLHRRGLTALFSALCLILQLSWGEGLRIALIPDPQEEVINPFAHELAAYAAGLGMLKHNVTLLPDVEDDETTLDGLLGSSNRTEDAYYDAILTQGKHSSRHAWPSEDVASSSAPASAHATTAENIVTLQPVYVLWLVHGTRRAGSAEEDHMPAFSVLFFHAVHAHTELACVFCRHQGSANRGLCSTPAHSGGPLHLEGRSSRGRSPPPLV